MNLYKQTQIGYLIITVTIIVLMFFVWLHITQIGTTNLLSTFVMLLVLLTLTSFTTLTISINNKYLQIKFGWGVFRKNFLLSEIVSAKQVKNHWYYGWGIRLWLWPKMWIYNVSGFDAVEIIMKGGEIYRIGTNTPQKLEIAIKHSINNS